LSKDQLDIFLRKKQQRAYTMALLAVGNKDDALDIVQDAMYKLVEKYRDKSNDQLAPLFHRILQSRINDWYRRKQVRKIVMFWGEHDDDEHALTLTQGVDNISPERQLTSNRQHELLLDVLAKLPLRQQQCFLLRCWEGYDVAQTAKVMECSQGSVKTHYSRALKVIRPQLDQHYLSEEEYER